MTQKLYRFVTKRAVFGVITEDDRVVRAAPYSKARRGQHIDTVKARFKRATITVIDEK